VSAPAAVPADASEAAAPRTRREVRAAEAERRREAEQRAEAEQTAASTVAAPRPHAPKAGRRASDAFSDAIEKPAGGRRALVAGPTTALPGEPAVAQAAPASALPASAPPASAPAQAAPGPVSRRALRENRGGIAKGGLTALAMIFAAGIAVATSVPASALFSEEQRSAAMVVADAAPVQPGQQLTAGVGASAPGITRDDYSVRDIASLEAAGFRIADTFTNNPAGAIQWPFPVGVPISDGFGARESPGGIGSTNHMGVDFAPGLGTPIQAIADGVVRFVQPYDSGGLGVHVIIDHVVDGRPVSSVYGHMLPGSITVAEGQVLKVAQQIGQVGNTGTSTGPHLHLEIRLDGVTPTDPFGWLTAHAV
jgi:murein DD-endopeptidase MepM/ murein hydrolase activator NlpD